MNPAPVASGLSGTVLVVDDSESERELVESFLTQAHPGLKVLTASNGPTALQAMAAQSVDLVILDYRLPVVDGLEVLKHLLDQYQMPVIMVTGMGSQEVAVEALRLGAVDYVTKSVGYHRGLPMLVERHLRQAQREREHQQLMEQYKTLVEHSPDPIYQLNEDCLVFVNLAFCELFAYSFEELTDPDFGLDRLLTPRSQKERAERKQALLRGEEPPSLYRFTGVTRKGEKIELETNVSYQLQPDGSYLTQGVLRVIDHRLEAPPPLDSQTNPELVPQVNNHLAYASGNLSNVEEALELGLQLTGKVGQLLESKDNLDIQNLKRGLVKLGPLLEETEAVFNHVSGDIAAIKEGLESIARAVRDPSERVAASEGQAPSVPG